MSVSRSLHHVTFDAGTDALTFTCQGDDTAKCHNYPDCDCETWDDNHEHPAVLRDRCWMQDWFDNLAVSYDSEDVNDDGYGPTASGSGFVQTEFEEDYILWSWVEAS
jgi:hypothetical protein